MGTGEFAVEPLRALAGSGRDILAAVSQPDRPKGRGLVVEPTPVKRAAEELGVPVWQPESLKDEAVRTRYRDLGPDLLIVAAYGKILPDWIIKEPLLGAINIHGSLLPAYRGAAPIQRAIINGEAETGATIVKIVPEVDAGDILLKGRVEIGADETSGELFRRLSVLGARLIVEAVELMEAGEDEWRPQEGPVSYAPKIDKGEALIDWRRDALSLRNLIRGLNPNPGAYVETGGKRVKIWRAAASPYEGQAEPGQITEILPAGPLVACGTGALLLTEVQPAGKAVMSGADFVRGHRASPGDMLK